MNTHPQTRSHHQHHLRPSRNHALSDRLTQHIEQKDEHESQWDWDWEIVSPDKWWETPFTSVSWAYQPKAQIRLTSKSKPHQTQFRGSLFLTETRGISGTGTGAGGGCSKRLLSSSKALSSSSPSMSTTTTLPRPRQPTHHRISKSERAESPDSDSPIEAGENDEGHLNTDLVGVQSALSSLSIYERDVGFHYNPFPDLELVDENGVPLVPRDRDGVKGKGAAGDLSKEIDETVVKAGKDQWCEMKEDLLNGPAFDNEDRDSDESLESSFVGSIGSISSSGSADSIPMPSTPKPKPFFTHNDVEIKATSPSSSLDAIHLLHNSNFHNSHLHSNNVNSNLSPIKSLPLSATATSFVPTFCNQLNDEPLPLPLNQFSFASPPPVSASKEQTTTTSFLNFTFPTLNPPSSSSITTSSTQNHSEKDSGKEKDKERSPDSGSGLLPPFLLQELQLQSSSSRSRTTRKSRTREIVDRLRSRTLSASGVNPEEDLAEESGVANTSSGVNQLDLSIGLISPKKYGYTQSLTASPIGGNVDESLSATTFESGLMGLLGNSSGVGKRRASVSEDGVDGETEEKGKEEDGWIEVNSVSTSPSAVEAAVSPSQGSVASSEDTKLSSSGSSLTTTTSPITSPIIAPPTIITAEHEQKAKRTRELFMALRRRRTDSGSSGESLGKDSTVPTTGTGTIPSHSRAISFSHSAPVSMSIAGSVSQPASLSALGSNSLPISTSTSPSHTPCPPDSNSFSPPLARKAQSALDLLATITGTTAERTDVNGANDGDEFHEGIMENSSSSSDALKDLKTTSTITATSPSASAMSISPPPPPISASSPSSSTVGASINVNANPNAKNNKKRNHNPGRSSVSSMPHMHQHQQQQQYFASYYPQLSHSHLYPHTHTHQHSHSHSAGHSHLNSHQAHTHQHSHSHSHLLSPSIQYFMPSPTGYTTIPMAASTSPYAASGFIPLPATHGVGYHQHQHHPIMGMGVGMMPMTMSVPHMNMNMMSTPMTMSVPLQQQQQRVPTASASASASYRAPAAGKHAQLHSHSQSLAPQW